MKYKKIGRMHDRMEKWKGMDEIDGINNTREGKEWKWMEI